MTAQPILETLAKEFSTDVPSVQAAFEMLDAGLSAPFIGRFRRARTGAMSEVHVRRLQRRREELQELDRRRGTILRALERTDDVPEAAAAKVRSCMDRFELEDHYVPFRRPEPEVQLALDRGLGALADLIVAPVPKDQRKPKDEGSKAETSDGDDAQSVPASEQAITASEPDSTEGAAPAAPLDVKAGANEGATEAPPEESAPPASEPTASDPTAPEPTAPEPTAPESAAPESAAPESPATESAPVGETAAATAPAAEGAPAADAAAAASPEAQAETASAGGATALAEPPKSDAASPKSDAGSPKSDAAGAPDAGTPQPEPLVVTAALAQLCAPFVDPDKGVHTEVEALAGAVRILSDRIGRDPALRGFVRRVMRKKGVLRVRPLVDEKKAGRHKSLLKLKSKLPQLQGHKLTAIRQAQKERAINTFVELAPKEVIGRVRSALGKHTSPEFDALLDDIASKSLQQRLLPVVEEDIRLELKERCDAEATRFLGAHVRQILVTPFFGRQPVCGVDVSAKGDLALAVLDIHGALVHEARIETGEKDEQALGAELGALFDAHPVDAIAVGAGKSARAAGHRVRTALRAAQRNIPVMVVNDAGATSYANGARARAELPDASIPTRLAMTFGRRLQDPIAEFLKIDAKQLGIGPEQRLLTKAGLRRVLDDAVASAVAFVGCDFDTVPRSVIEALPGLSAESAARLADKRDAGEIESREQIRADGILSEAEWVSVAAFLRIRRSPDPLDRTTLHPEQYSLARQLLESAGGSVEESLGRPGATKGLRREAFEVDEFTWRDLMRELSFPGRDPRGRNRSPEYVSDATDPVRLQPGRVVEGVVTNVQSFGAFVDIGRKQDAMVHISQIATRYVRDARELLSIGQSVRAKIVPSSSSRLTLSLKDVPAPEKSAGGRGGSGGGGARGGARGRGSREREREAPKGPAGRIWRRDGAAGAATTRGGTRRGGARRGGRGGRPDRGERVDLAKINASSSVPSNNPFANFFKKDDGPAKGPKQKKSGGAPPSAPADAPASAEGSPKQQSPPQQSPPQENGDA